MERAPARLKFLGPHFGILDMTKGINRQKQKMSKTKWMNCPSPQKINK
jgi:hypothetical protein